MYLILYIIYLPKSYKYFQHLFSSRQNRNTMYTSLLLKKLVALNVLWELHCSIRQFLLCTQHMWLTSELGS